MKVILSDLAFPDAEISISFVGDDEIQNLNRDYRRKDAPTNVLSFAMMDSAMPEIPATILGDVVISTDTAIKEAQEIGIPDDFRITQLLIHGILHLVGYDHETGPEDEQEMIEKSNFLMDLVEQNAPAPGWLGSI